MPSINSQNVKFIRRVQATDLMTREDVSLNLPEKRENVFWIYFWLRETRPDTTASNTDFIDWIKKLTKTPMAKLEGSVSHGLHIDELTLGSSGLSSEKEETLNSIASDESAKRVVRDFVGHVMHESPTVIYSGFTIDLQQRTANHLSAGSPFREYLDKCQIRHVDMDLIAIEVNRGSIDVKVDKLGKLLEMIAQCITVPHGTDRRG